MDHTRRKFKEYAGSDEIMDLTEFLRLLHDRMIPRTIRKTIDYISIDIPLE